MNDSSEQPMATIDEELNQIERDVRTLKIEYEQYFGGGRSRPPADTQWRVETLIRRYNERSGDLSVGQRFRFNNLAQTYAKYVDMWRKKTLQKETGATQHHYGSAAKAIEAERAKQAAQDAIHASSPNGDHAASQTEAIPESMSQVVRQAEQPAAFALSFVDPDREKEKIQTLYSKLMEARTESGEKAAAPSLNDFERFVLQKTRELKNRGGKEIEYTVTIENGRVKLKARISS